MRFENYDFYECTPFLLEASYNAYPKFELKFKNCRIYTSEIKNALIVANGLHGGWTNGREELRKQEFPDVYIDGLRVYLHGNASEYFIYKIGRKKIGFSQDKIPGLKKVRKLIVKCKSNNKE